jgi:hypothetical protein
MENQNFHRKPQMAQVIYLIDSDLTYWFFFFILLNPTIGLFMTLQPFSTTLNDFIIHLINSFCVFKTSNCLLTPVRHTLD